MSVYTTDIDLVDEWYVFLKERDNGNKDPNGSGLTSDYAGIIFTLYI
jgi:hypothetical protein